MTHFSSKKKYRFPIAVHSKIQEMINLPAMIIFIVRVVVSKYHSLLNRTRASWNKWLIPRSVARIYKVNLDAVFISETKERLLYLYTSGF